MCAVQAPKIVVQRNDLLRFFGRVNPFFSLLNAGGGGGVREVRTIPATRRGSFSLLSVTSYTPHLLLPCCLVFRFRVGSRCADCSAPCADWASVAQGCFVCLNCAGQHRNLGMHVTFTRSLTMDKWTGKLQP